MNHEYKEIQKCGMSQQHQNNLIENGHDKVKSTTSGQLLEKKFVERNSLITDLLEIKHLKAIYNIVCVIIIILFTHQITYDLIVVGRLNMGFSLIFWCFYGLHIAFLYWLIMNFTTILLYYSYRMWVDQRIRWKPKSLGRKIWDYSCLISFIFYQILFLCIPAVKIAESDFNVAVCTAMTMEQLRLMMKTHAFVRTNAPRALAYKPHQSGDKQESPCPDFSKFIYFLFAPTLLYRDSYPRYATFRFCVSVLQYFGDLQTTKEIRWKFVAHGFMELFAIILCFSLLYERIYIPSYRDFGLPDHRNSSAPEFLLAGLFSSMLTGPLMGIFLNYGLLHAWMNPWAEMLRFADRLFYKEWWTANSLASYYRLWNTVVNDWLYTFIYKDCRDFLWPGQQVGPTLAVFIISGVFHEYIAAVSLRFLYPMLFISYAVLSVPLMFMTRNMVDGNLYVWLSYISGGGLNLCLYGFEWYARINCPRTLDPFWDKFVPRSWTCANI